MLYTGQVKPNQKIKKELQKLPKTDLQVITLRAKQAHIKRRQNYDPKQADGGDKKRVRRVGEMGNLKTFPCLKEECWMAYSCSVPEEREHKFSPMPGIENSGFPEQVISLPDPNRLEPMVTMETKKLIFKPEGDSNANKIARDQKVLMEKPDIANKTMVPLSLMGRDEAYLKNMLWLVGASQVILWGVGNGMMAWVCICLRIPILCIYDNELHKATIEKHLLDKIEKAVDDKNNKRFHKTDAELGVSSADDKKDLDAAAKKKKEEADNLVKAAAAKDKKGKEGAGKAAKDKDKKKKKSSSSGGSSSTDSSSPSEKSKGKKKKK
jgi:hypothetical protein